MAPVITDPYRPPVGATPSDDIQLEVKSRQVFPTGRGMNRRAGVDTTEHAHI
jgi:hypothetical protein